MSSSGSPSSSGESPSTSKSNNNTTNRSTDAGAKAKKRRLPGACDVCKRKKIRCDSGEMPGNRCTNCVNGGFECTHVEVTKNLGSAKGYVEGLEQRLEKMESLLNKLLPGVDLNKEVEAELETEYNSLPRNDDDGTQLTSRLSKLRLEPSERLFFGKSSGFYLVQTAWNHKVHYTGDKKKAEDDHIGYWDVKPWQRSRKPGPHPEYWYPEEDLMISLVELYFRNINPFLPLLHRPTFEKGIQEGLHFSDPHFGGTVLLVCALGARYSGDPRVYNDTQPVDHETAGWKYFEQVEYVRPSFIDRPTLHEIQLFCLGLQYCSSIAMGHGSYKELGLALRMLTEVGAHRAKKGVRPNGQDELWKRAFWVLLCLDRNYCSMKGRPSPIHEEDFDAEYPIDCDDEYWDLEDPAVSFKQPVGKPSSMSHFVSFLKLSDISAYASRTIYAIRKPKSLSGRVLYQSDQHLLAELDSALNSWLDSVSEHLRWDGNRKHNLFFRQSVILYTSYYSLQIFIHKPFIPTPRHASSLSFPSLAICTNAARSCSHVLDVYLKREAALTPLPLTEIPAFQAGVVLLLNIWSGRRAGLSSNNEEYAGVETCVKVLKAMETRWNGACKLRDVLTELAEAGQMACGDPPRPSKKRSRDPDPPTQATPSSDNSQSPPDSLLGEPETPPIFENASFANSDSMLGQYENFTLPLYGSDLGRLPIYAPFDFNNPQSMRSSPAIPSPNPMEGRSDPLLSTMGPAPSLPNHMPYTQAGMNDFDFFGLKSSDFPAAAFGDASGKVGMTSGSGFDSTSMPPDLQAMFSNVPALDDAAMSIWSTAPMGTGDIAGWNNYISNLNQMHQNGPSV